MKEQIVLKTRHPDKHEFVESFRDAVMEVFGLLFERRELDLREPQLYALGQLAYVAQRLDVERVPEMMTEHGRKRD